MYRALLSLVCWLCWCAPLRAEVPHGVPFDESELAAALGARVPELDRSEVLLAWLDGRLLVTLRTRVRVVELGTAQHAEAARVVALVLADLAREEPPPAAPRPEVLPAPVALPIGRSSAAAPTLPDRARFGVDVTGQRGLVAEEPWSLDAGLSVSGLLLRRLVLSVRAGYMTVPSIRSRATSTVVRLDALSLRPAVGVRFKLLELMTGPSLIPYWVHGGAGHNALLAGGSVQLTLWLPVVRSLRIAARVCFDVFGNRARIYAGGDRVLTTPRSMLGLSLGFAWGWS